MLRDSILGLALATFALGCAVAKPATDSFDESRILGISEDDERTTAVGAAAQKELIANRFPGAQQIDLVRVELRQEPKRGPCLTTLASLATAEVSAAYTEAGALGLSKHRSASSMVELVEQGWSGTYRSPAGVGFERRAPFRDLDLRIGVEWVCRCSGLKGQEIGDRVRSDYHVRWRGPGEMPEVSGRQTIDGETTGLKVAYAPGHLLSYELDSKGRYPGGRLGRCGGQAAIRLLVDPPMR